MASTSLLGDSLALTAIYSSVFLPISHNYLAMSSWFQFAPYQKHLVRKNQSAQEEDERIFAEYSNMVTNLPKVEGILGDFCNYQGVWLRDGQCKAVMAAQDHFKSLPNDIVLASLPKSGTTWLKSLIFSVAHRLNYPTTTTEHPLLHNSPHDMVLDLEHLLYANNQIRQLDADFPQPRLFATHMPYTILPQSILDSGCRIVYVCRNPADTFVSYYHFMNKFASTFRLPAVELEVCFQKYIKGVSGFGPYWDHVLGYWRESLNSPERVLFLKYEELQAEPIVQLTKLAAFLGYAFTEDEVKNGVVDEISRLCSFDNLTNLEVNKGGATPVGIDHSSYFRKGKVKDSENYLTAEMIKQLDDITEQKLKGSGLVF